MSPKKVEEKVITPLEEIQGKIESFTAWPQILLRDYGRENQNMAKAIDAAQSCLDHLVAFRNDVAGGWVKPSN